MPKEITRTILTKSLRIDITISTDLTSLTIVSGWPDRWESCECDDRMKFNVSGLRGEDVISAARMWEPWIVSDYTITRLVDSMIAFIRGR